MEKHVHGILSLLILLSSICEKLVLDLTILLPYGFSFQVFTTAAYDDHKNIVLLAFEIIEKIIRDYFPYITETETTTFTDCVNCLIAFTNSRFNKDISLNAIAFLRFCATKLAEGDLSASSSNKDKEISAKIPPASPRPVKEVKLGNGEMIDKDDHLYFWFPLLAGKETAYIGDFHGAERLDLPLQLHYLLA